MVEGLASPISCIMGLGNDTVQLVIPYTIIYFLQRVKEVVLALCNTHVQVVSLVHIRTV
jgi:hypothetical protein